MVKMTENPQHPICWRKRRLGVYVNNLSEEERIEILSKKGWIHEGLKGLQKAIMASTPTDKRKLESVHLDS